MAYVFWTIVKKRWYVFGIMSLFTFITTVLSWNNTNLFVENLPRLIALHQKSSDDIYDVFVMPQTDTDGRILPNTASERQQLMVLLKETFFKDTSDNRLYKGKRTYLKGDQSISEMPILSEAELSTQLANELYHPTFFADLLVTNVDQSQLKRLEKAAGRLNVTMMFTSLRERAASEIGYYGGGALFALLVNVLASGFGLLLIYWAVVSVMTICQEDIRLLRVVGLSATQLHRQLVLSVTVLPTLGFMLALISIIVIFPWREFLIWDSLYLFGYQLLVLTIISKLIKNQLRRFLDA